MIPMLRNINIFRKQSHFDLRVGGGYKMSLYYIDTQTAGKTSGNEDRFSVKFVELIPYEKIVQLINFESDKKEFAVEMTMEVFLEDHEASTKVTIVFKNIPSGIDPKDNETGTEQSLEKLSRYFDNAQQDIGAKNCC
jgi:uncharacterized protein YndB with AHSA1/START domain